MKNTIKCTFFGRGGAGKSSVLRAIKKEIFNSESPLTVGIDFEVIPISHNGDTINFLLYDLGGQERFEFIHNSFVLGTFAYIFVFDASKFNWVSHYEHWINLLHLTEKNNIFIFANKMDLDDITIHDDDISSARSICNFRAFKKVSALTGNNVEKSFSEFAFKVIEMKENRF